MKIDLHNVKVSELAEGYVDKQEEGVRGYGGRLNIRPAYQREFIHGNKEREAVIQTVRKGFPLNAMYWAVTEPLTPRPPLPAIHRDEGENASPPPPPPPHRGWRGGV